MFSSLRPMDNKRRALRLSCAFFQKNLPTRRTSEQNSCYGWRFEWYMEARSNGWSFTVCDELCLFWSVNICFSCLIAFVCWFYVYVVLWKFILLLLFSFDFEWGVKLHKQLVCEVTLPSAADAAAYISTLWNFTLP